MLNDKNSYPHYLNAHSVSVIKVSTDYKSVKYLTVWKLKVFQVWNDMYWKMIIWLQIGLKVSAIKTNHKNG